MTDTLKSCQSHKQKKNRNIPLGKCWNWFSSKQPHCEPHQLFNQTRKLTNVPNCLFSSSHPPPTHTRATEGDNGSATGRSAKGTLQGQLTLHRRMNESTRPIVSHISLLPKGKVCGAQQRPLPPASEIDPNSFGEKAGLWQFMMPTHVAGREHETRWRNHPGFWTVSLLFFGEL